MTTPAPGGAAAAPATASSGSRVVPLVDLHGRSAWSILPPLILGFFMIMVDTTIVNIAVPTLQTELDASLVAVGWVNSAYLLSYAVLLLLAGRLGDRYGPKPVFVVGLAVFTLASAWCGLSGSIGMLVAARVVQGVGAALMTPQTMAMITRVFPPRQRGAAMGLWGATAGVATIAGPLLGGLFVESWGWSGSSSSTSRSGSSRSGSRSCGSLASRRTSARSTSSGSSCRSSASSRSCSVCRRARRTRGGPSRGPSRCGA